VNGIPYAYVSNMREHQAARSFIDEPFARYQHAELFAEYLRPSDEQYNVVESVLYHNALVGALHRWFVAPERRAFLLLRYEGTTKALRMFSVVPSTNVPTPRTIFYRREGDETKRTAMRSTHPMYPLLMWPVAFPTGTPLRFADGTLIDNCDSKAGRDDGKDINLQKSGLFLMMQPERRDRSRRDVLAYGTNGAEQHKPGAFVLVRTHNQAFAVRVTLVSAM